jgi:hypothetical protein
LTGLRRIGRILQGHHVRPVHFLGITLAALCAAGCGKSPSERITEAAISAATGNKVDVDKNGGQVTFKSDQGEMKIASGESATLPASFPKDVWLPAKYTIDSVMEMPNAQVVSLAASGSAATMFADASRQMQAQGWKQTMAMQQAGSAQMLAFEKDQRSAMLTFDEEAGAVKLGMQLTTKQ